MLPKSKQATQRDATIIQKMNTKSSSLAKVFLSLRVLFSLRFVILQASAIIRLLQISSAVYLTCSNLHRVDAKSCHQATQTKHQTNTNCSRLNRNKSCLNLSALLSSQTETERKASLIFNASDLQLVSRTCKLSARLIMRLLNTETGAIAARQMAQLKPARVCSCHFLDAQVCWIPGALPAIFAGLSRNSCFVELHQWCHSTEVVRRA